MKQLVIMPGGFHPFHPGHLALYQSAQQAFPGADVKVAATNDTSTRPFPFKLKEKIAQLAGVPAGDFYQVKSPFRADEITKNYDPATTQLIFVRSKKDSAIPPIPGGIKRDGNPAYLQPISRDMAPMTQHAYMAYLPVKKFGPGMTGASDIRAEWPTLDQDGKIDRVMSLYPRAEENPKLAKIVVDMWDEAMGGLGEAINNQMNVGGLVASYQAKDNQPISEEPQGTVEAYGYAYNNRDQRVVWRKIFPSEAAAQAWADSKNATVLGMKNIQQPANEDYVEERRS